MIQEKVLQVYQRQKVANLIKEVDALWGGNDVDFLQEYIAAVLLDCANDLQSAIDCFEGLKKQALALGKTISKPVQPTTQPRIYHPTFREHYERTGK